MEDSGSGSNVSHTLWDISASLFELRDALVEMSILLKDWQFEADLERRKIADHSARQLLNRLAGPGPRGPLT